MTKWFLGKNCIKFPKRYGAVIFGDLTHPQSDVLFIYALPVNFH